MIATFVTGNFTKAFSIGFTEVFTKIGLFYLHERVWYKIKFGMKPIENEVGSAATVNKDTVTVKELSSLQATN